MNTEQPSFNILKAYEARLKNNNIDINVILYSENHIYEYNPWTRKVRPFDSILWYDLGEEYEDLLDYISDEYDIIRKEKLITGNYPEVPYADMSNNTVAINLEKLKENISASNKEEIIDQCEELESYITNLYEIWNELLLHSIETFDKYKLSIIFK